MSKELSVDDWCIEIDRGLQYRRRYGMEDSWAQIEALFYNVHESQTNGAPNVIMGTGDAVISTLTVPYPSVVAKARNKKGVDWAPVVENVADMLLCDLNAQQKWEESVLHTFMWGKGIMKFGYDSAWGYDPDFDIGRRGQPAGMTMTQFDTKGNRIEFGDGNPGMPWMEPVLPHDFVVPWGVKSIEESPWAVHRVVRHIDDIKSDPKYENKKGLTPQMSMEDFTRSYLATLKPYRMGRQIGIWGTDVGPKAEYVELWEIHDRRTGRVKTIASGYDKFLRDDVDYCQVKGRLPFVELTFTPKARTFWTTPDAFYLLQAQAEITDITIQASKQRKISVLKFLYDRTMITHDELQKALSSEVGLGIAIDNLAGQELSKAIQFFQPPGNQLLYQEGENVRRNAREAVGMSRNQQGEYEASGRRTAFEAKVVDDSSKMRMSRRHIGLARSYQQSVQILQSYAAKFWTAPRIAMILDEEGQEIWKEFTGQDIDQEYFYKIGFTSSPPQDEMTRKQEAIQIYASMRDDPTIDPVQLRRFLSRAFNDPDFNRIFKPGILAGDNSAYIRAAMQGGDVQGQGQGGRMLLPPGQALSDPSTQVPDLPQETQEG